MSNVPSTVVVEAVRRIAALGFQARVSTYNDRHSIQVRVAPGDPRIMWGASITHTTPICNAFGNGAVAIEWPCGFYYSRQQDTVLLSHSADRDVDALVLAHLFEQEGPIKGPMSMTRHQLHELEAMLAAQPA